MSHHVASLQFALGKAATAFDLARSAANRLYWLDDNYVQPFYAWAAPRLRDVAISGFYWVIISLIDVSLWLIDTTSQFMARDAQAIAFSAFAQTHEPLPEFLALPPATVPLALPPVLALCPAVLPMDFKLWLQPDDSVRRWLTAALPLALAPSLADAVPEEQAVVPGVAEVTEAAPVVKKSRQSNKATDTKKGAGKTSDKSSRRRSPRTTVS